MFNKYEKAIMEQLLDILETENLASAPAARIIDIDEKHSFSILAKLFGEEIVLSWHSDELDDEVFVRLHMRWKKNWPLVVAVFAAAMKEAVEG